MRRTRIQGAAGNERVEKGDGISQMADVIHFAKCNDIT